MLDLNDINLGNKHFTSRTKNGLKSNIHVRNLWYFYKTFCINKIFFKLYQNHGYNILFLKTPGFVKDIIKEAQREGHGIYCKRGSNIIEQFFLFHKVAECIFSDFSLSSKQETKDLVKEIKKK